MPRLNCKIEAIRSLPLLSLLTDEQLAYILPTIRHRSYPARTFVLCAGDPTEGLYFVRSGTVHLMHEDGDAREVIIAVVGPNEFFGEHALFESAPKLQSAMAHQASDVLFVPRAALLQCLERNPAAAMFMMRTLTGRLAAAHTKIANFALIDVYGRVARVLSENARPLEGEWIVELGSTMMAAMVGASREMVSRVLRDMMSKGVVRRQKRKLLILDRPSLLDRIAHQPRKSAARSLSKPVVARDNGFALARHMPY